MSLKLEMRYGSSRPPVAFPELLPQEAAAAASAEANSSLDGMASGKTKADEVLKVIEAVAGRLSPAGSASVAQRLVSSGLVGQLGLVAGKLSVAEADEIAFHVVKAELATDKETATAFKVLGPLLSRPVAAELADRLVRANKPGALEFLKDKLEPRQAFALADFVVTSGAPQELTPTIKQLVSLLSVEERKTLASKIVFSGRFADKASLADLTSTLSDEFCNSLVEERWEANRGLGTDEVIIHLGSRLKPDLAEEIAKYSVVAVRADVVVPSLVQSLSEAGSDAVAEMIFHSLYIDRYVQNELIPLLAPKMTQAGCEYLRDRSIGGPIKDAMLERLAALQM